LYYSFSAHFELNTRNYIDCLENAQKRVTKMVSGLKKLSYVQRLKRLNLTTLEEIRNRGI